ncbi:hypothetical protein [Streptomyces albireticuli]|uniref:hypothetical protein n=1 Tax=Streptomyces albireticuli TaxID=1940 RepID=UPI00368B1B91
MPWDGGRGEASARLPAAHTPRMVCPTKYPSLHGYRCAHLLVPAALRQELADLHINLHGDVAVSDRLFAHRAADVMTGHGNGDLVAYIRDTYARLTASGALAAWTPVEAGFFLFGRPRVPHRWFLALDERYFELDGHPGYVRINLLHPTAVETLMATVPGGSASGASGISENCGPPDRPASGAAAGEGVAASPHTR